jgi:hypothetical protein
MLATSGGRLICLSTPYGKRGFFYDCWANGGDDWHRIEISVDKNPRVKPGFVEQERRAQGESWFRQEYCCSFEALEGLVYPDFARCVVPYLPPHVLSSAGLAGRGSGMRSQEFGPKAFPRVGGIDFGFRNPFAAIWGVVDRDNVLWLTGEHYSRERPLSFHADHLPRDVQWYADPSGAGDIAQLVSARFKVRGGDNAIRPGIAAVRARLENGTLRVLQGACPNLLAEAALYRYNQEKGAARSENPEDEHNHALGALRYLISKLDARLMARFRKSGPTPEATDPTNEPTPPAKRDNWWMRWSNEELWTRLF